MKDFALNHAVLTGVIFRGPAYVPNWRISYYRTDIGAPVPLCLRYDAPFSNEASNLPELLFISNTGLNIEVRTKFSYCNLCFTNLFVTFELFAAMNTQKLSFGMFCFNMNFELEDIVRLERPTLFTNVTVSFYLCWWSFNVREIQVYG